MPDRIPEDVAERVLATHPLPIADAFGALVAADSAFEQRDRVVEVFRAALRTLSAFTLAARVQYGPGPGTEPAQIQELIRSLRGRGLTDGQWFAVVREMLRPWTGAPGSYPLPELVTLVHGKKAELPKLIDELLVMRKSETVAHGASGTKAAIREILDRRVPQLVKLLTLLEPLWARARLLVPLSRPEEEGEPQPAWSLMGYTPPRGRWRRVALAPGVVLAPGEAVLTDADHRPILALHPLVLVRRPSPEVVEELFTLDGGSKKGAVYVALPSMAEHRETEAWTVLSRALSGDEAAPDDAEAGSVDRPFRGLSSFGPEHAALFFGREEQTEALANRVRRHAFVTVTGPSGSGKTSLLRAGALPQLSEYRVIVLRPGADPMESLAHRLSEAFGASVPVEDVGRLVREDPGGLGSVYRTSADAATPRLVIVVDQSEEVFTLCEDEAKRLAFARALAAFGAPPDGPFRVVLSVREDFFGRFATLSPLRGLYSRTVEVVTTPDREALARTLYLPAKQFGYAFEDEALILEMVDAVAAEPAALALLQFCADRLWEVRDRTWKRLSWDAYRALGGVAGALAAHADRTLAEMSSSAERAARGLMLRLVTAERTRATATRKELLESAGSAARDDAEAVLDRLIAARLLTVTESDGGGDARVEIVHEALIRHWGRLAAWLSEDEEGQRLRHALTQAAREWDSRGRAAGLLWSGDALSDLRRWRKRATDSLSGVEAAFFEASEADERRGRRLRRVLLAGAFGATAAFGAFMFWQWRAAESARAETEQARGRAEVRGLVSEARNMEPLGRSGEALALLRAATALEGQQSGARDATAVSVEMERLGRSGAASLVLAGHGAQVRTMAISADRRRLVTASPDGTARIWDVATGMQLQVLGAGGGEVRSVSYSSDDAVVVTAANTAEGAGALRWWDAVTGKLLRKVDLGVRVGDVQFAPGGGPVLAALAQGGVALFDPKTGERTGTLGGGDEGVDGVERLVVSADGKRAATIQIVHVRVYDIEKRALVSTFANDAGGVMAIAFSPDGATLGVTSGKLVRLLDAATGQELRALETPDQGVYDNGKVGGITSLAFSPDGALVAAGGMDFLVRVWESATGRIRHQLRLHREEVDSVAFSPGSGRLASAALDGTAAVWDMASGALVEQLRGHEAEIHRIAFVTEERVATVSYDRTARIWDVTDGAYLRALGVVNRGIDRTALSLDGGRLAVAAERSARVFDLRKGAQVCELGEQAEQVQALAISPDGARVVTGASDGAARVWDVASGQAAATLAGHGGSVTAIAYSADGKRIATADVEGAVHLWDAASGARAADLREHRAPVTVLVSSPDGRLLASGARDGTAVIWDAGAARMLHVLRGPPEQVMVAVFTADGSLLATGRYPDVRLWDTSTGELRATLGGYEQSVLAIAISPDGKTLAGLASDGVAKLWSLPGGEPIRELRAPLNGGYDVAFSPDGERLFVAGGEGQAFVWHVATGTLLERLAVDTREPGLSADRVIPVSGDQLVTVSRDGSLLLFRSPPVDRLTALFETGRRTTYRVCRSDFRVVSVGSIARADSVWAPEPACTAEPPAGQPSAPPAGP